MLDHYEQAWPRFPPTEVSNHEDVNERNVENIISRIRPDIVLVSGTNLLRQPLIELISRYGRVMNLHTGISPYIKGGPNCTNWCLALRKFDLIGNTVMWLDKGIDSGNIIATEQTSLTGMESLGQLHLEVMEHAHDLYVRCFSRLQHGYALSSIRQSHISEGRMFLNKQWNSMQMLKATINHLFYFKNSSRTLNSDYVLVNLDNAGSLTEG